MSEQPRKPLSDANIEEAYNRHKPIAARVQEEYDKCYREMFADISPACLEPFAEILLQHENYILNKEVLIERIQSRLSQVLPQINENFFLSNDLGKKLITLEVLKERFEPYKGTNWNVNKLTPEERTRPTRMRLMDSSIRFLENKIKSQEQALEVAMAKSKANRNRIQNIQNERIKLNASIQQQLVAYKETVPKLMELHEKLAESKAMD